ncbi:hypothetical protein TYRP_010972 [Tyrophagus putrescentiae]|nr:hypothetical protein TYRP_010972 [Tyrophagus putrescentiae]
MKTKENSKWPIVTVIENAHRRAGHRAVHSGFRRWCIGIGASTAVTNTVTGVETPFAFYIELQLIQS